MPKRLLRSVIEFDTEVTPENLIRNFQQLRKAVEIKQLEWNRPEDEQIYKYTSGYFIQHFEMPSAQTLFDYFQGINSVEVLERLKDIQVERSYARTNFVNLLRLLQEDQAKIKAIALLKETHEILTKGVEDKRTKETRKGLEEAILHFTKRAQEIRVVDTNVIIHGDIRKDGAKMREEYELAENDKSKALGVLSGINEIDDACKGVKKGELWIHAAFTGELKSTLANNWCYSAVTRYKKHVVYVSFEMTREQIRRSIYTIHTANARFTQQGYKPLDYGHIRDGLLTKEEKNFYYNLVIQDFVNNPTYARFDLVTPDREWTMDDVRAQVELLHKEFEVGLVILDHGQWIEARKNRRNKDYTIEINSVINDAKRFALTFDHNNGVPVLMLFQINREGKAYADKNDGTYRMQALTYANNCCAKGTLISTDKGLIPIEDVKIREKVWSSTSWKTVLSKFDNGVKPIVEIQTDRGLRIQVTRDHSFRTLSSNGLEWIQASDLLGKYVLSPFNIPSKGSLSFLPKLEIHKWERLKRNKVDIYTPKVIDPDLAYLLGVHAGDGLLSEYDLGFCGNKLENSIRKRIQKTFKKVFNQKLNLSYRKGVFNLVMGSKPLVRWFIAIGSDRQAGVPSCVLQSSPECMLAFLRGFWDTDGHINTQGNISIGQKAAKRQTLEQVQLMLNFFGIDSAIHQKIATLNGKKYPQEILWIRSRRARKLFAELIGFTEPYKQMRLKSFVIKFDSSRKRATLEEWPVGDIYRWLINKYVWSTRRGGKRQLQIINLMSNKKVPMRLLDISNNLFGGHSGSNIRKTFSAVQYLVKKGLLKRISKGVYEATTDTPRFMFPRKCRIASLKITNLIPRGSIEALLDVLTKNGVVDPDAFFLKHLLETVIPHKIISVTPVGKRSVYDLEVSGDEHEYTTGGLLTHNCEKTADVITTTYLNNELRAAGFTKFTNLKNRDNALFPPFQAHINFNCRKILSLKRMEPTSFSVEGHDEYLGSIDIPV